VPDAPPKPEFISSDSASISLTLSRSLDDGGSPITSYKLFVDAGDDFSSDYAEIGRYDGTSTTFDPNVDEDGLVNGKIYRFVLRATNSFGDSAASFELIAGLGAKPPAPSAPVRDPDYLDSNSIILNWGQVTGSDLPILGYVLMMDDGLKGYFSIVYDGSDNPQRQDALARELISTRTYRFKAYAIDVNGAGVESDITSLVACIPPTDISPPVLEAVGKTTLTLAWKTPRSDGGCPITSYALFRDDGEGSEINIPVGVEDIAD